MTNQPFVAIILSVYLEVYICTVWMVMLSCLSTAMPKGYSVINPNFLMVLAFTKNKCELTFFSPKIKSYCNAIVLDIVKNKEKEVFLRPKVNDV